MEPPDTERAVEEIVPTSIRDPLDVTVDEAATILAANKAGNWCYTPAKADSGYTLAIAFAGVEGCFNSCHGRETTLTEEAAAKWADKLNEGRKLHPDKIWECITHNGEDSMEPDPATQEVE